jgi:hypothetical protein
MHGSKLSTFVIDCKTDDLPAAARFWSAALRRELSAPQAGDSRYRDLVCAPAEPLLMIQRVEHDSRVHLDIESEDIEAEALRLERLGARVLERVHTWVVMEAPTGHRFCVVRPQRPAHTPPPFELSGEHAALARLSGHYRGTTRTYPTPVRRKRARTRSTRSRCSAAAGCGSPGSAASRASRDRASSPGAFTAMAASTS